jgi:beta-barrel assembly-enhancing protease
MAFNTYKLRMPGIALVMVFLLTGCSITQLPDMSAVRELVNVGQNLLNSYTITPQQEAEFGKNMSAMLLGTSPLSNDDSRQRYVNNVGAWLAANSDRPELNWRFGVIRTSSVNAFAAPGGYVFITEGMLNILDNEAELAAVLSHEIIHVTSQHHLNAIKRGALRTAMTDSASILMQNSDSATATTITQTVDEKWIQSAILVAKGLYVNGLSRGDEFDSDAGGLRLLAKSGYDAYAYASVLQKLSVLAKNSNELKLLSGSHPPAIDRLDKLSPKLASFDNLQYAAILQKRFAGAVH